MRSIEATIPSLMPPGWSVLERQLIAAMDEAVDLFIAKYTRPDGGLQWDDKQSQRIRSDAFYESIHNWPLFYILGGGDHVLSHARRVWDGITRQLSTYGILSREYHRTLDWFHQGEGNLFFYYLCLADPQCPENRERALRFAGFYTGEDPEAPNYDPERRLIRSPRTGSDGPRWTIVEGDEGYGWSAGMAPYGLPRYDVPGITRYEDLRDPALAQRMGNVMNERMGRGDVVANLAATTLVANVYLLTGAEKYRRWVLDYVETWFERARANGGLLPDNVGLSGVVGEYMDGKWYGGLYGWTWPHGFYNIAMVAIIAAGNAYLLSGDARYLEVARDQLDRVLSLGELRDPAAEDMSLRHHWIDHWAGLPRGTKTLLIPYRYGDIGWFDYQPPSLTYPLAVWNLSGSAADWERIERIRAASGYDWRTVHSFRNKEECGHEAPWIRYLAGDNPGYPEEILREAYGQVIWRLDLLRTDTIDLEQFTLDKHHYCDRNPVLTEALLQLTLGAPQTLYNGGLPMTRLRYYDAERRRPGLPRDVAALIKKIEAGRVTVHLVNLSPRYPREVLLRAGTFGEHRFTTARYAAPVDPAVYPGRGDGYTSGRYAPPALVLNDNVQDVDDGYLLVRLRPGSEIILDLGLARFVASPSMEEPWSDCVG